MEGSTSLHGIWAFYSIVLTRDGRNKLRPSRMGSRHLGGLLGVPPVARLPCLSWPKFVPHIFATMSGMFDLSIDEKAKLFLPRWFSGDGTV